MSPRPEHSDENEAIERLLAEVIGGERSTEDPELLALLERRPDLRSKLDELRDLGAMLDTIGVEQREDLVEARTGSAPGEERVVAAVRAEMGAWNQRQPAKGGRARANVHRWLWPVLAVAAAVIVGLVVDWGGDEAPHDDGAGQLYYLDAPLEGASPLSGERWPREKPLEVDLGLERVRGGLTIELFDGQTEKRLWTSNRLFRASYTLTDQEWNLVAPRLSGPLLSGRCLAGGQAVHSFTIVVE